MALIEEGRFSAAEWADSLSVAIRRAQAEGDPDDGSTYYNHVLEALERLVLDKLPLSVDLLVRSLLKLGAKPRDIARAIA